jgi:hypothetical protein
LNMGNAFRNFKVKRLCGFPGPDPKAVIARGSTSLFELRSGQMGMALT